MSRPATQHERATYPAYRPSGMDWVGDIPDHWGVNRLKFVANTVMGQSPNSDDYTFEESDRPFLQGNAEFGVENPTAKYYCETATKTAPAGSLLVSVRAPVGALNMADRCYGIGRGLCAVIPDQGALISRFAWHTLTVTRHELWSIATGSTYEAVSADEVADMTVPIPPLTEQRAIAAFLDRETARIDALIEKKRLQSELLQEKRSALIHQAIFHPETKDLRLRHVADHVLRSIDRKDEEVYTAVGLYNWARGIFQKEPKSGFDLGDSNFFWLKSDDLILSGQFAWEGAVALASEEEDGCVVSHRYHILRGKPHLMDTAYLWAFFTTTRGHFLLDDHSRGAAGRNRPLNINTLGKELIPVPPLFEQQTVAEHVYFERRFKKIVSLSIDLLQEYRAALISAAVTGKIDVRREVV